MNLVNLAYMVEQSGKNSQPLIDFVRHHAVPIAIGVGIVVIGFLILAVWANLSPDEPTDEGPRVTGTAQVLSVEKTARVEDLGTVLDTFLDTVVLGQTRTGKGRYMCRIELEVHIPGREPYVRVMQPTLNRASRAAAQPGRTFVVEVDEANPEEGVFQHRLQSTGAAAGLEHSRRKKDLSG